MGLQTGKDVFGIAKQSGKGVIAANPYFAFGLVSGGIVVDPTQEPDKLTSAFLSPAGAYRSRIDAGAGIETRAWQKAIGLLLLGALGSCSTSQAPAPVAIATSSEASPTVITTTAPHLQGSSGTKLVTIAGHVGSTPAINGSHTATMTGPSTFTLPVEVTVAGTGGTVTFPATSYSHIITLGDALDYFTVFEVKGDGSLHAVKDCKIDELDISWTENMPLLVAVTFVGGAWSAPTTFAATVDESDTTDYFTPVGGTFKYDVDSDTPAEASVLGGHINIKRSVEAKVYSGAIEPGDVFEGGCAVETSLTVMPDDMTLWRNVLTGAVDGSAVSSVEIYGSFEHTFVKGADSLKLAGAKTAFLCDMPTAEPEGGGAELELAGVAYRSAGTPLTATLVNMQASY
jgi:hypothetical protein